MSKRPNLLMIIPDQMRQQALGFWREEAFRGALRGVSDPVHTPHLDRLAAESLVLNRATATTPVCSPFRGMFFSGRYPERNGVPYNCGRLRPDCQLRPELTCLTDVLDGAGWDCVYIGKLHLDHPHQFDPERPDWYPGGWDVYTPPERRHGCRFWHSYGTFDVHKDPHYWNEVGERTDPGRWSPLYEADVAADYLRNTDGRRPTDRPFALTVCMNPPHTPNEGPEDCEAEDFELYAEMPLEELLNRPNVVDPKRHANGARHYFAQVTGVDRAVGRILRALEESGEADDTVVLFCSDHGELLGSHDRRGKNAIWQESFAIPCLIRVPGLAPRIDGLRIAAVDFMPTLLGLLGLGDRLPADLDGTDFSPLWTGTGEAPTRPKNSLFMRNAPGPQDADDLHRGYTPLARGIVDDRHTLLVEAGEDAEPARLMLFDDEHDPYQLEALPVGEHVDLVEDLLRRLDGMLEKAGDSWAGRIRRALTR